MGLLDFIFSSGSENDYSYENDYQYKWYDRLFTSRRSSHRRRVYTKFDRTMYVIGFVFVLIFSFYKILFSSTYRFECVPNKNCSIYVKKNKFSHEFVSVTFNPKDIKSYDYVRHTRSKNKYTGKYQYNSYGEKVNEYKTVYYNVYSVNLNMKDGTNIDLSNVITKKDKSALVNFVNDMWYGKEIHLP